METKMICPNGKNGKCEFGPAADFGCHNAQPHEHNGYCDIARSGCPKCVPAGVEETKEEMKKEKRIPLSCKHSFQVLSTKCTKESDYYRNITYRRVDEFFCTKCLKVETKVRHECIRDFESAPDWVHLKGGGRMKRFFVNIKYFCLIKLGKLRCNGWGVYPNGVKCCGCSDCRKEHKC